MARGDWGSGWNGGGNNDARPGNAWESPQYSRRFDPRSEQEYTSRFLEVPDQLRLKVLQDQQAREERESAELAEAGAVHFFPSVGKFVIPEENTWAAHAALIRDERNALGFNAEKYVHFDGLVAEKFPDILKPEYAGLRTNIAVLRNDVIGMYLNDGSFDPGDEIYVPAIQGIAKALGQALANDKSPLRLFTRSLDSDVANVEGVGAEVMYNYLYSIQDHPGPFLNLVLNIKQVLGMEHHAFGLPPISETALSPENMAAPPPPRKECFTQVELKEACAKGDFASRYTDEKTTEEKQTHVVR